jgi:hypothetical protein
MPEGRDEQGTGTAARRFRTKLYRAHLLGGVVILVAGLPRRQEESCLIGWQMPKDGSRWGP